MRKITALNKKGNTKSISKIMKKKVLVKKKKILKNSFPWFRSHMYLLKKGLPLDYD